MARIKTKKNSMTEDNNIIKKQRKIKDVKVRSESEEEIRRFIIILIVIIIIVVGIYFLSKVIVDKRESENLTSDSVTGEINYDILNIGMILNRPYSEYYVMLYNSDDTEAIYYSSILTNYTHSENPLKIYFCDLGNSLNSKYVSTDGNSNSKATTIDEFSFGKITLLKIKNGKIVSYVDDIDKIIVELN